MHERFDHLRTDLQQTRQDVLPDLQSFRQALESDCEAASYADWKTFISKGIAGKLATGEAVLTAEEQRYVRALYARAATLFCSGCGEPVPSGGGSTTQTPPKAPPKNRRSTSRPARRSR